MAIDQKGPKENYSSTAAIKQKDKPKEIKNHKKSRSNGFKILHLMPKQRPIKGTWKQSMISQKLYESKTAKVEHMKNMHGSLVTKKMN